MKNYDIIKRETGRQEDNIELIASEILWVSQLWSYGIQLTNKYAEGYPGKNYGGCAIVDEAENSLEIEWKKFWWRAY